MNNLERFEKCQPKVTKSGKTRSELGKAAKRSGKSGERKIVTLLNKYSQEAFERIPNSGAFTGGSNRDKIFKYTEEMTYSMLGDIYPPVNLKWRWIIESKNYSKLSFKMLEVGEAPSILKGWIDEIQYDTETYCLYRKNLIDSKDPFSFLVVNIKKQGFFIVYNKQYFGKLNIRMNPIYSFIKEEEKEELKKIGFGNDWGMEDFKTFMSINNKILFGK